MLTQPEKLPQSFDFYRSYTQWVGGLSFVYLVVMLFYPERKLVHMRGMIGGGMLRSKQLIITISIIFTIYTAVLSILVYLLGNINNLNSISIVISAISGGGFVPTSTFLPYENTAEMLVLVTGMIISALPFAFHYAIFSREVKTTLLRPEIFAFLGIILISIVAFHYLLSEQVAGSDWLTSAFHTASASTTSGFQYINMSLIPSESKLLLIIVMLIGGCAFSSAGGIKVVRLLQVAQKITRRKIPIDASSRSISSVSSRYNKSYSNYEGKAVRIREDKTLRESLLVICLFIFVSFTTGIALSYFSKYNFIDSIFESVSALTTTGLSTGITNLDLDLASKALLIVNMIVGRFEIIAILYIFFGFLRR
jgi:trk system potassium uptake protein